MVKTFRWFGLLFSVLAIAGCGGTADGTASAQINEPGINLSMSISSTGETSTTIPANDDAKVDIVFLDAGGLPLDNEIISLSATSGTLSQSSVLTDHIGRATVTIYSPDDLVSGTAPGILTANSTAFTGDFTLNYQFAATISDSGANTSSAGSIQFISATPEFMSLKGTGGVGYGETSQVTFKVVDIYGAPIEGATINFNLSTTVGGLSLSPSSAATNSSGLVTTTVQAGTISTPVRVGASVTLSDGKLIYVQSDLLTVTTGIPDQNSIDLSFDKFAPEGWEHNGQIVNVTAHLGDRFNNPVPDGTVVNFTTEGGLIQSSCQTVDSACSVVWSSQNPRPADGRSTVMAYAIGHETYYDVNANGVFDDGDSFDDLGEAFRDDDESGTYNPTDSVVSQDEKLIDYDENGVYTGPDGVYNGVPCEHTTNCPTDANNVAGRSNFLTNVRKSGIIVMANDLPNVYMYELIGGNTTCLDASGKLSVGGGGQCRVVTDFAGGLDVKNIWAMVEDPKALCKTSINGAVIPNVIDPNNVACTYAVRQSAPTGSAIAVSSDVGTLSTIPYAEVPNQLGKLEFVFTITSDDQNTAQKTGVLEVKVTTGFGGTSPTASASLTDPIN